MIFDKQIEPLAYELCVRKFVDQFLCRLPSVACGRPYLRTTLIFCLPRLTLGPCLSTSESDLRPVHPCCLNRSRQLEWVFNESYPCVLCCQQRISKSQKPFHSCIAMWPDFVPKRKGPCLLIAAIPAWLNHHPASQRCNFMRGRVLRYFERARQHKGTKSAPESMLLTPV